MAFCEEARYVFLMRSSVSGETWASELPRKSSRMKRLVAGSIAVASRSIIFPVAASTMNTMKKDEKQALVLVNRGGATGADVASLMRAVQDAVSDQFGIDLSPEPVFL